MRSGKIRPGCRKPGNLLYSLILLSIMILFNGCTGKGDLRFNPPADGSEFDISGKLSLTEIVETDLGGAGIWDIFLPAPEVLDFGYLQRVRKLEQRIGRVDRRMNPAIEARLMADHPEVTDSRSTVSFWNFLPPDELNKLLTLYSRVTQKTLLISKTLGIEGKQLLTPEDDYEALKEFNHNYEGTRTVIENLHLEYRDLIKADPALEAYLKALPGAMFSGRQRPTQGTRGVFFCYALPAFDKEASDFTEAAGTAGWYLYDLEQARIFEEPAEIVTSIRAQPNTPRHCTTDEPTLLEIRAKVEKHIKNTYLKRINAPVGVKPTLKCWMELNEG